MKLLYVLLVVCLVVACSAVERRKLVRARIVSNDEARQKGWWNDLTNWISGKKDDNNNNNNNNDDSSVTDAADSSDTTPPPPPPPPTPAAGTTLDSQCDDTWRSPTGAQLICRPIIGNSELVGATLDADKLERVFRYFTQFSGTDTSKPVVSNKCGPTVAVVGSLVKGGYPILIKALNSIKGDTPHDKVARLNALKTKFGNPATVTFGDLGDAAAFILEVLGELVEGCCFYDGVCMWSGRLGRLFRDIGNPSRYQTPPSAVNFNNGESWPGRLSSADGSGHFVLLGKTSGGQKFVYDPFPCKGFQYFFSPQSPAPYNSYISAMHMVDVSDAPSNPGSCV